MRKQPELKEAESCAAGDYRYDFALAERIVSAMGYLRKEAEKTNIEEVVTILDATYRLLATTYHCILRGGKLDAVQEPVPVDGSECCSFARTHDIITALDFLRKEAVKTQVPEIVAMIDAAFRILVTTYCCILRYKITSLPGTEEELH
jgi:hypothetical protein